MPNYNANLRRFILRFSANKAKSSRQHVGPSRLHASRS